MPDPYFLFYAPNWTPTSNGITAMHLLCHRVREKGQRAYLIPCIKNPDLDTPLFNPSRHKGDMITVYPEITHGNPLMAPVVVRWLLYYQNHDFVCKDDLFFTWYELYNRPEFESPKLCLHTIDESIFHPPENGGDNRPLICYYARKFRAGGGLVDEEVKQNFIDLDSLPPGDKKSLAELFRLSEYLLAYELSAVSDEAMLCGCPTVELPTEGKPYSSIEEMKGRMFDAMQTKREKYDRVKAEEDGQIDRFIETCLRHAGGE